MARNKTTYYQRIYYKYKLLALNMFTWVNLPPTIEGRHIEHALYEYGQALFYDNPDVGLICLPCSSSGEINHYGEPTSYIVNSYDIHDIVSKADGIRIINNDLAIPTDYEIRVYASKMLEVQKSIDINVKQQRFPYFVEGTKDNKFSIEQAFKQKEDGEPYIIVNKDLGLNDTKVHTLNTIYVVDKLNEYKYELEREILTFLGLNNNFEKKERLLVDEVNSNNDYIDRNVDIMYSNRKRACKLINDKYGLKIDVIKNNDLYDKLTENSEVKDGEI